MLKNWKSYLKLGAFCTFSWALVGQANAQCPSWDAYPDGVEAAKEQHVIYRDLIKVKQYEEAFPKWQKLFETVKIPLPAKTTHFKDGIKMYKTFAKDEKDKTKKAELLDKMSALYDEMAGCLGEQSKDRGWQGYYIYSARGSSEKAIEAFEKSIELGKNETPNMVLVPLTQLTVYLFGKKHPKFTDEYMRNQYDKLKEIVDYNIENKTKEADKYKAKWEKVEAEYKKIADAIWGCEYYERTLRPEFEKDKKNMEENAKILAKLKEKCGVENALYVEVNTIYKPWKDSVDDAEAERRFNELCNLEKGKFRERKSLKAKKAGDEELAEQLKEEAFDWYEKALDDASTEDCSITDEEKGELAYRVADRHYRKGSYGKARSLCYKAAELKSGWGAPYMLIGTMYASSGKRCSGGKGTGWDAQVVAWAAMDMWSKAKSVDPSVAGKANSQIAKYKKYLPTQGDIFQRGYKVGGSYKIGCWINVTTTIRAGGE